jgi:ammonia channel protein AmtB
LLSPAFAAETVKVSAGDTAWVLTSSALVLLMTAPGLALFYAGMARRKNVLATLMQSFILAALISFSGFLVFSTLWATFIYDPLAHWVWGVDGWIHQMGALDFAGGTVVHISSGVSALAAILIIGRRRGYPREPMLPHNQPDSHGHRRGTALGRMVRL